MASTSPLQSAAVKAAAKVRSKISKSTHDRYPWLFISRDSKEDVKPVVECWLSVRRSFIYHAHDDARISEYSLTTAQDKENLRDVSSATGIPLGDDRWSTIVEYYPIIWTRIAGRLESPFPGNVLVIIGQEYVNQDNGLPKLDSKSELFLREYVALSGDEELELSDGGGGASLFVLLKRLWMSLDIHSVTLSSIYPCTFIYLILEHRDAGCWQGSYEGMPHCAFASQ